MVVAKQRRGERQRGRKGSIIKEREVREYVYVRKRDEEKKGALGAG